MREMVTNNINQQMPYEMVIRAKVENKAEKDAGDGSVRVLRGWLGVVHCRCDIGWKTGRQ